MMYKKFLLLAGLPLLALLPAVAQGEAQPMDKQDIRIAKTLQGVRIGTDVVPMVVEPSSTIFPLDVQYFREDRIAPVLSLHSSVGVRNLFERTRTEWVEVESSTSQPGGATIYETRVGAPRTYYNLDFRLGTELRWHINYRNRVLHGKHTRGNGGWFLSVPLEFTWSALRQPSEPTVDQWTPGCFHGTLSLGVKVGYRYAFGEHWHVEASALYAPLRVVFNDFYYRQRTYIDDDWQLNVKVGYVF